MAVRDVPSGHEGFSLRYSGSDWMETSSVYPGLVTGKDDGSRMYDSTFHVQEIPFHNRTEPSVSI